MQGPLLLGINVGESFTEYCLLEQGGSLFDSPVVAKKRVYTPREAFKSSLKAFSANLQDKSPQAIYVGLSFLAKIQSDLEEVAKELITDIQQNCAEVFPSVPVHFLTSAGEFFSEGTDYSLLADASLTALGRLMKPEQGLLLLTLEKFQLIQNNQVYTLPLQPTSEIVLNSFGHFQFASKAEGWEPGPMLLGRGQKTTLIDLWMESPLLSEVEGLRQCISASSSSRFQTNLWTLNKVQRQPEENIKNLISQLQELAKKTLVLCSHLKVIEENLIVTGALAPLFGGKAADDFMKAKALALYGHKHQGSL